MDEPSGGTQRFSGHWILTNVFVTQADILTSALSTAAPAAASPYCGTLPYRTPACFVSIHSFTVFYVVKKNSQVTSINHDEQTTNNLVFYVLHTSVLFYKVKRTNECSKKK